MIKQMAPTTIALCNMPMLPFKYLNKKIIGTSDPRMKFGTVVVTVALRLVPNCSEAMVTKVAQ
jgi:hypothetical protein